MKKTAIYRIASLVMALIMILGNTATTRAATNPSIYWGALVNGNVPSSTNLQGSFNTFETRSTKKMSIIHWGQPWKLKDGSWGEFQTTYFTNVRNHGSIPMINWASQRLGDGINQTDFQLRDITNGNYDTYVRRWATDAKNWGHPLFMRFNHEMNGWWFPWGEGKTSSGTIVNGNSAGDFVKAWRHVHDIFVEVGATNVTWVWAPNHVGDTTDYAALSTVYPGDAYVDWTGFDVYNKYSTWAGLNPLLTGSEGMTWFKNSYDTMLSIAPNKPIMLAEFASVEAGDGGAKKADWITDALTTQIPINFPKIKAVVWMNWDVNAGKTYPIESSQAAINAWAAGIGSAVYASNQFANLDTSPISPLTALSVPTATVIPASPTATVIPASPIPTATTINPLPTTATSTVLIAVADSYIDSANPSSTFGTSTTLYVNASPLKTTFLKFDLSPLAGKTLSSVILKFKTTSATAAGSVNTSNVKLVNDLLWKELYLSYTNTIPISDTLLGTIPSNSTPGTWYNIPLSAADLQNNIGGLLSIAIEATGSDNLILFSREAVNPPQLIITYQ